MRFGRPVEPIYTPEDEPFVIGQAVRWSEGNDVTILATGHLMWRAIQAAEQLEREGVGVDLLNIHTIKRWIRRRFSIRCGGRDAWSRARSI